MMSSAIITRLVTGGSFYTVKAMNTVNRLLVERGIEVFIGGALLSLIAWVTYHLNDVYSLGRLLLVAWRLYVLYNFYRLLFPVPTATNDTLTSSDKLTTTTCCHCTHGSPYVLGLQLVEEPYAPTATISCRACHTSKPPPDSATSTATTVPLPPLLQCAICDCETTQGPRCNEDPSHSFCAECFNNYARIAFEAEGEFERQINENGIVSQRGQLPCPLFRGGHCPCHDMTRGTMAQNLDEENLRLWTRAAGRIAVAATDAERQQAAQAQEEAQRLPCAICDCEITEGPRCNGDHSHSFCAECFNNYTRVAFEAESEFEREINENGIVSQRGQLPCPLFRGGHCPCHDMTRGTMAQNLDDENLLLWTRATGRIAVAARDAERQQAAQAQEEAQRRQREVDILRDCVAQALEVGGSVACPGCGLRGLKDDACKHIRCQSCGCRWCYCCGRPRGDGEGQCSSCDTSSMYLEDEPGWNSHGIGGETQGYGALHEFHRRRMAVFLQQVRDCGIPRTMWQQLLDDHPDVFQSVPTEGRSIQPAEIDSASPPVFGVTREHELRWTDDVQVIIADLLGRLDDVQRQQPLVNQVAQNPQPALTENIPDTDLLNDILGQAEGQVAEELLRAIFGDDGPPDGG